MNKMKKSEVLNNLKDIQNNPLNHKGYILFEPKDEIELVAPLKSELTDEISEYIMKSLIGKKVTINIGDENNERRRKRHNISQN